MAVTAVPRPEVRPGTVQLLRPLDQVLRHLGLEAPAPSRPLRRVDRFSGMIRVRRGRRSSIHVGGVEWLEAWLVATTPNGGRLEAHWTPQVRAGRELAPAPWVYEPDDATRRLMARGPENIPGDIPR